MIVNIIECVNSVCPQVFRIFGTNDACMVQTSSHYLTFTMCVGPNNSHGIDLLQSSTEFFEFTNAQAFIGVRACLENETRVKFKEVLRATYVRQ